METRSVERKLAAIFAADVAGYSRLMGLDEVGTLRTLTAYRAILDSMIASHRGRIFNTAGDSVLADFASGMSKRLKRPRDPIQLGKLIVDIATGQVEDRVDEPKNQATANLHNAA